MLSAMRNLTFKQFDAVAAIARRGSVARAARELHLTPAALTARLRQIESELGLLLFDRTPDGLRPTEAGRAMLATVERVDALVADCIGRLAALRGLEGGRVGVAVVSTAKYFAPRIVAAFSARHPRIEIRLFIGNRAETIARLRDYDADFAIMGRPPPGLRVVKEVLGEHPLVFIVPPTHPLIGRRDIPLHDLAEERFIVREEGSGTRAAFAALFEQEGAVQPAFGLEIGSNETIKQAVIAGLGIALISAHTIEAEVDSGRLAILDVSGMPIRRTWFVVRRADKEFGPAAQAFWDFVVAEAGAVLPRALVPAACAAAKVSES